MRLSKTDENTIVIALADMLKRARIMPSGRVSFQGGRSSVSELQSSIGSELNEKLVEVCGELGLYDFARHTLSRELISLGKASFRKELSQIPGFEDNLETAKRLTDKLKNVPDKVLVVSPLPTSYSGILFNGIDSIPIADGIFIEKSESVFRKFSANFSSREEEVAILRNVELDKMPNHGSHFLCTWHSTFVGSFYGNSAIQAHQDKLRSLYGCLLALRVVEEDYFFDHLDQHAVLGIKDPNDGRGAIVLADPVDTDLAFFYENFDVTIPYLGDTIEVDSDHQEDGGSKNI